MGLEATVGGKGEAETRNVRWTFLPPNGFAREGKPWICKPNGTVWRQQAGVELPGVRPSRTSPSDTRGFKARDKPGAQA